MLIDLNEDYISVFVGKSAFRGCGLQLQFYKCSLYSVI